MNFNITVFPTMSTQVAKIAVSLTKELLEKTDAIASAEQMTRSAIVAQALAEFIQHRENQELLVALNQAYEDRPLTEEEAAEIKAGMSYFAENLIEEW